MYLNHCTKNIQELLLSADQISHISQIKREELKSDLEAVHMVGVFQCDECVFTAIKREVLMSHVETVHRGGIINVTSVI